MSYRLKIMGVGLIALLAVGGLGAPGASGAKLVGTAGAVNIHGTQATTHKIVFTDNSSLSITCTTATFTGSIPAGGTETPVLHPEYSGCTQFGLSGTFNTSGCDYEFHIGQLSGGVAPASTDIECGTGAMILTTLTCELKFKTQQGLVSTTFINKAGDVEISTDLKAIKYEVTKDGIGCPLKGVGSYTEMDYSGTSTLTASSGTLKVE